MKTLVRQVFSGAINPGQLEVVREILDLDEGAGNNDVAVYRGSVDDYTIVRNLPGGGVQIIHDNPGDFDDGTDTLYNVEKARFAGGVEVFLNNVNPTGAAVISDTTPTQGFALSADTDSIDDPNGTTTSVSPISGSRGSTTSPRGWRSRGLPSRPSPRPPRPWSVSSSGWW